MEKHTINKMKALSFYACPLKFSPNVLSHYKPCFPEVKGNDKEIFIREDLYYKEVIISCKLMSNYFSFLLT
ncbi:hypothetical protein AAV98_06100 [Bacillus sp. CHD6a]|nr:hypothetical protein AAV98_06100 [Bacillus sp. CHD6a]